MKQIGYFVTSHGYGHAARVSAILDSLFQRYPHTAHIFTSVPQQIFNQTLRQYTYHNQLTDIGLVQTDAFQIDLDATISQLRKLVPFNDATINFLAKKCENLSLIICDISPLGIRVAQKLGIPSVLIESFTWDWIYRPFQSTFPELAEFSNYFREQFGRADYHIQTEPLCNPGDADLHCGPIFRRIRTAPEQMRKRLPCGQRKIVLITMGGIKQPPSFLNLFQDLKEYFFIFAGQEQEQHVCNNVLFLDKLSPYYHPDLINCADIIVCKGGYSTIAECYQADKATICVQRDDYAESEILEAFAKHYLQAKVIVLEDFLTGKWLELLPDIIARPPRKYVRENGADVVADFLLPLL